MDVKLFIFRFKEIILMLKFSARRVLKTKEDQDLIPKNTPYCYHPDTFFCKFYCSVSENYKYCGYTGILTDDPCFWDQIKICGIEDPQ